MGRLYLNRVYLAGPMDRADDGGLQWRAKLTPWLNSRGIVVFDPTNKPCELGQETPETRQARREARDRGDLSLMLADKPVRQVDLRMVDISDFLIVNLDMEQQPCGTFEEVFLANREKKPILAHSPKGNLHAPDWMYWTIPPEHVFGSWEDIQSYIDHIDSAPLSEVNTLRRWVFFNLGPLYDAAIEGAKNHS
jgi:nucleoside 2-deoxyribosyltransferase